MLARLLRLYSYFYHLVLSFLLFGIGLVAKLSDVHTLRLEMLPWTGDELVSWLVWGGLAGLLSVILAVTGLFIFLFPLWALLAAVMMARGFLILPYTFDSKEHFYWVLAAIAGALLAFLASLTLFRRKRR